ncbi:MAG: peptidoglycan editing factor PgeF [Cellulomonadaceae bacterium]
MATVPLVGADLGPGVLAGFTTVRGGVSTGPWRALNLGLATDDEPRRVLANRDLLEQEVGRRIAYATQVHGADVVRVLAPPTPPGTSVGSADALVTTRRDVAVAVLVADCVPVVLADGAAGVGAVVHAGRRGLVAGVVPNAVAAMVAAGARPGNIAAVVGPAACGACYEVPAPLRDEVAAQVPGTAARTSWGTPSLDLPAGVLGQLREAQIGQVHSVGRCTIEDEDFFSYRRAGRTGQPTGRFAGVVAL